MNWINLFNAFWIGGTLCALAQILIDKTAMTPARIMVSYVVAGVILTAVGLYDNLVNYAGCGATVPIIGFGYTLASGVKKAVDADGLAGALYGGTKACAGGISAAVFFGLIFSLIFKPKGKN